MHALLFLWSAMLIGLGGNCASALHWQELQRMPMFALPAGLHMHHCNHSGLASTLQPETNRAMSCMQLVVILSMLCLSLCRQKVVANLPTKTRLNHNQFVSSFRAGGRTLPTAAAGASTHFRAHMCCLLPSAKRVLTPDMWI